MPKQKRHRRIPGFLFSFIIAAGVFAPSTLPAAPSPDKKEEPKSKVPAAEPVSPLEEQTEFLIKILADKGYAVKADAMPPQFVADKSKVPTAQNITEDVYQEFKFYKKAKEDRRKPDRVIQQAYRRAKPNDGQIAFTVATSDGVVTLGEAMEIGLKNNLNAKAAVKKIDVARSKMTEARRALFPTVQIVTEANGGKAQGSATNLGGRYYKGKNTKLNVTQPLFYGGELVLTYKQAEANWKTSIEEFKKAKAEFIQQIKTSYLGVVKNAYNLQYQEGVYKEVETIYRRLREERARKLISEIDYLNAESQYYEAYFQREAAKNELLAAQLLLNQVLGVDPEEPFPVDMTLEFVKITPRLDEILEVAMRQNPDVKIKELAVLSAELGIKIYKAKKLPKIDLRGSYGMLGEVFKDDQAIEADNADLDTEPEWFLGMGMSMPLGPNTAEYEIIKHKYGPTVLALTGSEDWRHKVTFSLFDKLADITDEKNAEATYLQALSDLDKAKNDLIVKVRDEFYNMQKSLIQIDSSLAKLRYQEKQVKAYRYLVGLQETTITSLIEGMVEQAQSKFSFIQAVSDYHAAVAALNTAIGDTDYFQSTN